MRPDVGVVRDERPRPLPGLPRHPDLHARTTDGRQGDPEGGRWNVRGDRPRQQRGQQVRQGGPPEWQPPAQPLHRPRGHRRWRQAGVHDDRPAGEVTRRPV